MKILVNIFLVILSALIVFFNDFIGADFTQMNTLINFFISTVSCTLLFKLLYIFSGLGKKRRWENTDDKDD